jgi:pyridoxal phosphate enzyme (YggS family)
MPAFRSRLESVRERIAGASRRSGRSPGSVTLVAVTKTVPSEVVREAMKEGVLVFGENRIQEARRKVEEVGSGAIWHLVGHLQRNKARDAARIFEMIHSVDSPRPKALIQVNLAGEATKHGAREDQLPSILEAASRCRQVEIKGLMILPPYDPDPQKSRRYFRGLAALAERLGREKIERVTLDELSMGMSEDFEVAIEEGATLIRVGSALFGERPPKEGEKG